MKQGEIHIATVNELNRRVGHPAWYPLVTVLDAPFPVLPDKLSSLSFGFYTIFMVEADDKAAHGGKGCDFHELVLMFHAPGEVVMVSSIHTCSRIIAFQEELFAHGCLFDIGREYSFFQYRDGEALHISLREKRNLWCLVENLVGELEHTVDSHSRELLSYHIMLVLESCQRFYERQFYLRTDWNKKVLSCFNRWLDSYILRELPKQKPLPSQEEMADTAGLSPAYLSDMLRLEVGHTLQEHIRFRLIEAAKQRISDGKYPIACIARELGFTSVQTFNSVFKRLTGCSPSSYRSGLN